MYATEQIYISYGCGCCYTVAVEAAVSLAACVCLEVEVSLCEFAQ